MPSPEDTLIAQGNSIHSPLPLLSHALCVRTRMTVPGRCTVMSPLIGSYCDSTRFVASTVSTLPSTPWKNTPNEMSYSSVANLQAQQQQGQFNPDRTRGPL